MPNTTETRQFKLNMASDLFAALAVRAKENCRSVSGEIIHRLIKSLENEKTASVRT